MRDLRRRKDGRTRREYERPSKVLHRDDSFGHSRVDGVVCVHHGGKDGVLPHPPRRIKGGRYCCHFVVSSNCKCFSTNNSWQEG